MVAVLALVLAAGSVLAATASPAAARPAAPRAAAVAEPDGRVLTQEELRDRARERARVHHQVVDTGADVLDAMAPAGARAMAAPALPDSPVESDLEGCLGSDDAAEPLGRVYNRFTYCRHRAEIAIPFVLQVDGAPTLLADVSLRYDVVAYGDRNSRTVRVFFRTLEDTFLVGARSILYPQYEDEVYDTSTVVQVGCYFDRVPDTSCSVNPSAGVSRSLREWDEGSEWIAFDIVSDEAPGTGTEKVVLHEWALTWDGVPGEFFGPLSRGFSPLRSLRCDSATYVVGQGSACIFNDVIPRLVYSTRSKRHQYVAAHIKQAQDEPSTTWPLAPPGPKVIPGKYTGGRDDKGLHRLPTKPTADPQLKANTDHKNAACRENGPADLNPLYVGKSLPLELRPKSGEQCDEYPFRSVREGAASPHWDFSVKAVPARDNSRAGNALKQYFSFDRILFGDADEFWVEIIDRPFDDEADPDPSEFTAGPDVSAAENERVLLNGRADPGDDEEVRWTYAATQADPGTTCVFDDESAPQTFFRCTDDGLFEVTLNLDNGTPDELQTDSATVTIRNLPPRITSVEPPEWSLFRVGDPVDLEVGFTDSPNDTHRCTVVWDDGSVPLQFPAADRTCGRPHTFTQAGMYTMSGQVVDDDGGEASFERMVVVYDPKAGWANIDGGSTVPDGSYLNTQGGPTGGTSKLHGLGRYYPQADTEPVGRAGATLEGTPFRFDALGDTQVDWLVVTPDGKLALRGHGVANGGTRTGFVMYGWDGCDSGGSPGRCVTGRDRVRTVVWDLAQSAHPPARPGLPALFDGARASSSYDVDRSDSHVMTSGTVTIHR